MARLWVVAGTFVLLSAFCGFTAVVGGDGGLPENLVFRGVILGGSSSSDGESVRTASLYFADGENGSLPVFLRVP